jgi:cleavage and polyadenylation specificity factor subunit 1
LKEYKDTSKLIIFTLDLVMQSYHVITYAEGLPYDSMYLLPCEAALGGVIVVSSNALIYVDQAARKVALAVNGWPSRISDMIFLPTHGEDLSRNLELEGSSSVFVDDNKFFVFLKDGSVHPVEIIADGKNVSRLNMAVPLAQTTLPSTVCRVGTDHLFVGSISGPSVLLRTARIEEKVETAQASEATPTAVVDVGISNSMDLSDDEGVS